ncbi:MAG: Fur family iron response transcriptional regulator [Paracoccaceae bacterium]|jgi:Fur family iron response transcriptional regulator
MTENTSHKRPYSGVIARLKEAGLRPTRQRIALAKLLFEGENRHVTAEDLHGEARAAGVSVSLATIYNSLHQFTDAGIMREVVVEAGRSYFDTNTGEHHHFFHEDTGSLEDIPGELINVSELPAAPAGKSVQRVDVIVRVSASD